MNKIKNKLKYTILTIFLIMITFIFHFYFLYKKVDNHIIFEKIELSENVKSEVLNLLQNNLDNEYALLTNYNSFSDSSIIKNMRKDYINNDVADADINLIKAKKSYNSGYTGFEVKIDGVKTTVSLKNENIILKVPVIYKLPTKYRDEHSGQFITTEGVDYYDYKVVKVSGEYKILEKLKAPDFPNN